MLRQRGGFGKVHSADHCGVFAHLASFVTVFSALSSYWLFVLRWRRLSTWQDLLFVSSGWGILLLPNHLLIHSEFISFVRAGFPREEITKCLHLVHFHYRSSFISLHLPDSLLTHTTSHQVANSQETSECIWQASPGSYSSLRAGHGMKDFKSQNLWSIIRLRGKKVPVA